MKQFYRIPVIVFCLFLSWNLTAQTIDNFTTSEGLPDNFIIGGVDFDSDNNVWAGTAVGVTMFNGSVWTNYHIADGLADDYITCIAVAGNDDVWVGTDLGVSRFNGTTWETFTTVDGLVDNAVNSIAVDIDGSVWFGTTAGVSKFNGTTWTTFNTASGFPTDLITTVHIDAAGNKWFGTWENGVIKYDGSNYTQIDTLDGLQSQYVTCVSVDNSGNMLAGTLYGISRFNSSLVWTDSISYATGIYNDYIMDIDFSPTGVLWVSMFIDYLYDGGVSWYNGSAWASYNTTNGIADALVKKIGIDANENVWVCTGNGLSRISNYTGASNTIENNAVAFYPNPASSVLYFGETPALVNIFDMAGRTVYTSAEIVSADLSGIPAGLYNISVTNKNGKITRDKICIAR